MIFGQNTVNTDEFVSFDIVPILITQMWSAANEYKIFKVTLFNQIDPVMNYPFVHCEVLLFGFCNLHTVRVMIKDPFC